MYVIKVFRGGQWVSWASAASPKVVNQYLQLLGIMSPHVQAKVVPPV